MADTISHYANKKDYYFQFYSIINGQDRVEFPAVLTQLDDKFTSNWNSQNVFGRQDPIITFQNTQRTISVGFDVPSVNAEQAKTNLAALNRLINYLYPAFSKFNSANTISASPLFKIKFVNLIYDKSSGNPGGSAEEAGLVCGIQDFQHSFLFDGTAGWVDEVGSAIPSMFKISFSATILHTHDLGSIDGEGYPSDSEFPYYVNSVAEQQLEDEANSVYPFFETEVPDTVTPNTYDTSGITDGVGE